MSLRAGIVVTGTEVLSGRVSDRNGPWVSEQLGALGVEVMQITCVGDRSDDLISALRYFASEGVDLIVTSGGLGPTADDLTAAVVAEFAGVDLELDTELEARIAAIVAEFAKRMSFDPESLRAGTRKQAMVPRDATPLDPTGTAPGLVVPAGESVVLVLPGPPRELQRMWPAAIASAPMRTLLERAESYELASMKMFGIPESTLAKSLVEIEAAADLEPLEITTCLRRGAELEVDVRYREADRPVLDALFAGLRERHERYIYTDAGESIDELVAGLLAGRKIALAESCTAGMLTGRLTDTAGSSAYVTGGIVAYSNAAKVDLLGVPAELIEQRGAVSAEVAEAMADGAMERLGADVAVSVTGVAGPGGGTAGKPVGYVCFCAKTADGRMLAADPQLPGNRDDVRDRSVSVGMHMIRRLLLGEPLPF